MGNSNDVLGAAGRHMLTYPDEAELAQLDLMLPGGRRDRHILVWIVVVGPRPTAPYPALHGNTWHCPVEALGVDLYDHPGAGRSKFEVLLVNYVNQ